MMTGFTALCRKTARQATSRRGSFFSLALALLLTGGLLTATLRPAHATDSTPRTGNSSPAQPVNHTPADGAESVAFEGVNRDTITLTASPFADANSHEIPAGRHRYSQWRVSASIDGANLLFDSRPSTTSLTSFSLVHNSVIRGATTYYWRVRYADASGDLATMWSDWSVPTSFTTAPELVKDLNPSNCQVSRAVAGEPIYSDTREPLSVTLPAFLQGGSAIRPRVAWAQDAGPGTEISFSSDEGLYVFVAYDDRATTLPAWLQKFTPVSTDAADSKVFVADAEAPARRLLARYYEPGTRIELGRNLPATPTASTAPSTLRMYTVYLKARKNPNHPPQQPKVLYPTKFQIIPLPSNESDYGAPVATPLLDPALLPALPGDVNTADNGQDSNWDDRHKDPWPYDGLTDPGDPNLQEDTCQTPSPSIKPACEIKHRPVFHSRPCLVVLASAFKDPDLRALPAGQQLSSQWQISTAIDMRDPILDTGEQSRFMTALAVPWGLFKQQVMTYFVRVRYKDASKQDNAWSDWSKPEIFTIIPTSAVPAEPPTPATVVVLDQDLTQDTSGWSYHRELGQTTSDTLNGLSITVPKYGANLGFWLYDKPLLLVDRAVYRVTAHVACDQTTPNAQPLFSILLNNMICRFGGEQYIMANAGNEYLLGPDGKDITYYFTPSPALNPRFRDAKKGMFAPEMFTNHSTDIFLKLRVLDVDNNSIRSGRISFQHVKVERIDRPAVDAVLFDSDQTGSGNFVPDGTTELTTDAQGRAFIHQPINGWGGLWSRDTLIPWQDNWLYRIRFQITTPNEAEREDSVPFQLIAHSPDWQLWVTAYALDNSAGYVAPQTDAEVDADPVTQGWYELYLASGPASQLLADGFDGLRMAVYSFNVFTNAFNLQQKPGFRNKGEGRFHVRRLVVERCRMDN